MVKEKKEIKLKVFLKKDKINVVKKDLKKDNRKKNNKKYGK